MDGVADGPILQFLSRLAEIFQGLPVEKFDLACRIQRAHEPRHRVDDLAQIEFPGAQSILGALSVFDVGVRSEPLANRSIVVERRSRPEEKPAIHAIEAAEASFNFTWLA